MKTTVLIPVKTLETGKSRLTEILTPKQRETLIVLLFRHVTTVIKNSSAVGDIFVVSNDPEIIKLAITLKINHIFEKNPGHNVALTDAAKQVNQNMPLMTISADLPFVSEVDIDQLLSLRGDTDAVLVPSKEKTGTNAILLKKPLLIPYLFGVNSFSKFEGVLLKKNLTYKTYSNHNMAFDIDTSPDFEYFKSHIQDDHILLHKYYDKVL
jgi:2-phospho-L-lactate guanylyltransferase